MKIGIITAEAPYPDNSGGRKYTWERIKILSKLNNDIMLYCLCDENIEDKDINYMKKYCKGIKFYKREKKLINTILNFYKPYSVISRTNKNLISDLMFSIENSNIDILIVDMPQLIYNIPRKCNVPIVISQHNIEYKTFYNIAQKNSNVIKKIAYYFEGIKFQIFESKQYKRRRIDLFTFISKDDKEFFEKKYKKTNTMLLPMGISNVQQISRSNNNTEKKIVFVGKMSYYPNEEAAKWFCEKVFGDILKLHSNTKLYLVGKEPNKSILNLASKNVIVTGLVDDVNYYVDNADIVVVPLLSGGGVKIKLIEALSRGKIVISTSKGIEGTEFENEKHVLIADDEKEFAKKCNLVLEDPKMFKYLILNSTKILEENYYWEKIGINYIEKLNNILYNSNLNRGEKACE